MNLSDYGFSSTLLPEAGTGIPARITATHRERYAFICEHGQGFARLKASEYYGGEELFPTTGDFVLIDWQGESDSRITKTLLRHSCFYRLDPSSSGHAAQAMAANFDYVFIMQSLNHNFNPKRLERYLTLAWQSGATPAVILTKADLSEGFTAQLHTAREVAIGADVIPVSAKTGLGLTELAPYLEPGKTIVFLGSSGVGKSSLVNALAGDELMSTSEVRAGDSMGRHTTTHRQLIRLPSGVIIIDTPGVRELGMWDVTEGLGQSFSDVEAWANRCKFSDCRHENEPGCAIQKAIAQGELSAQRFANYQKLKKEAKFSDDKNSYLRARTETHKAIAKKIKNLDKYKKGRY